MIDLSKISDEELFRRWKEVSPVWPPPGHEEIMQIIEERLMRIFLKRAFSGFEFPWSLAETIENHPESEFQEDFNPDDFLPAELLEKWKKNPSGDPDDE